MYEQNVLLSSTKSENPVSRQCSSLLCVDNHDDSRVHEHCKTIELTFITMVFRVSRVLLVVFVTVMFLLVRGLRVAFQSTTVDIEIPVYPAMPLPPLDISNENKQYKSKSASSAVQQVVTATESPQEVYEWSPRPYEPNPRPPIEQIIQGWNVTGDPQWLINFAISAFPKCGTSTLMHYFSDNPEVQIHKDEKCELGANQHVPLIRDMYKDFPAGDFVRGLKCPRDLENTLSVDNYERFFPKTDMIVGIRHPVKWFESFYNHRVMNNFAMIDPIRLVGACGKIGHSVCTNRAAFHVRLATMGKTEQTKAELDLIPQSGQRVLNKLNMKGHKMTARVFLYEVEQLNDKNETRAWNFRKDLQRFLYLRNELPPMVWFKPGRKHLDAETVKKRTAKKINICDSEHESLREILMVHARNASTWIRNHFLSANGVHVSSRDHVETLLRDWKNDPCADGGSYQKTTATLNCTKHGCYMK